MGCGGREEVEGADGGRERESTLHVSFLMDPFPMTPISPKAWLSLDETPQTVRSSLADTSHSPHRVELLAGHAVAGDTGWAVSEVDLVFDGACIDGRWWKCSEREYKRSASRPDMLVVRVFVPSGPSDGDRWRMVQ